MRRVRKIQEQFLDLYRCGLWGCDVNVGLFTGDVDWQGILELARNQTVVGNLADGMGKLPRELRPDKPTYFGMIAMTSDIEAENKRMNDFIPSLMSQLRQQGIHAVLLKGQGVAACYRNPLHRMAGDVDLLIPDTTEYVRARSLMLQVSREIEDEDPSRKHSAFLLHGFFVELHGDFRFFISKRCRQNTMAWRQRAFPADRAGCRYKDGFILPPVRFDVVFIFAHLLGHFMNGGIGLRQVSDWMMSLHSPEIAKSIDVALLKSDLELLGLMIYWKLFASMAVVHLGFPKEEMPFYDPEFDAKGTKVLMNIFYTGNFGARQKARQLSGDSNRFLKKFVTLIGQLPVYRRNFSLFPKDTLYCFREYMKGSLSQLF